MAPKVVDREQRKRELALAALDVFAEKGFESASVSDVAVAAGISKGSIYNYFESKDDLIFSAITAWLNLVVTETEKVSAGYEDPAERLREVARAAMRAFLADERGVRLAMDAFRLFLEHQKRHEWDDLGREALQGLRKMVTDCLLEGVSQGIFRPETARDAERLAINLAAYLDGIGLHYYMGCQQFDLMEQVDFYVEGLLRSIASGDRRGEEQ